MDNGEQLQMLKAERQRVAAMSVTSDASFGGNIQANLTQMAADQQRALDRYRQQAADQMRRDNARIQDMGQRGRANIDNAANKALSNLNALEASERPPPQAAVATGQDGADQYGQDRASLNQQLGNLTSSADASLVSPPVNTDDLAGPPDVFDAPVDGKLATITRPSDASPASPSTGDRFDQSSGDFSSQNQVLPGPNSETGYIVSGDSPGTGKGNPGQDSATVSVDAASPAGGFQAGAPTGEPLVSTPLTSPGNAGTEAGGSTPGIIGQAVNFYGEAKALTGALGTAESIADQKGIVNQTERAVTILGQDVGSEIVGAAKTWFENNIVPKGAKENQGLYWTGQMYQGVIQQDFKQAQNAAHSLFESYLGSSVLKPLMAPLPATP